MCKALKLCGLPQLLRFRPLHPGHSTRLAAQVRLRRCRASKQASGFRGSGFRGLGVEGLGFIGLGLRVEGVK